MSQSITVDDRFFNEQYKQGGIFWLWIHLNLIEGVALGMPIQNKDGVTLSLRAIRDMNISYRTNNSCDALLKLVEEEVSSK